MLQALKTFRSLPPHLRALLGPKPEDCCPFLLRVTRSGCDGGAVLLVTEFRQGDAWGYNLHDVKSSKPTLAGLIEVANRVGKVNAELKTDEERDLLRHYEDEHSLGTVGFGKYRGYKVEDLMRSDPRYVLWANENISSFNEQIKENIEYI